MHDTLEIGSSILLLGKNSHLSQEMLMLFLYMTFVKNNKLSPHN